MASGNVSNFLKSNVGPESGFQFDDDPMSSAFIKSGYYTTTPHIDVRYLVKPQTQLSDYANQCAIIRIEKDHDFAGLCELQIPSPALDSNAGVYTYLRRSDWFGFSVIKEIQVRHNTHVLQSFEGDTLFPHFLLETSALQRTQLAPMIVGDLSTGMRERLGKRGVVARVPLDNFFWWTKNSHTYMNTQSYADEIKIYVWFHHKSEWVQTDSTTEPIATLGTVTTRGQTYELGLVLQQHHIVESERVYHHTKQLNEGVLEPFVDYINVGRQIVNANQNNYFKIEMKNLNMPVRHIIFTVRRATDQATAYRKEHFRYLKIVGYGMTAQSSGGEFVPFTPIRYLTTREHEQYHSSHADNKYPIYFKTWSYAPEDHINELGSLHFGNINNPELVIYIGTAANDSEARDVSNGNFPGQALGVGEQLIVDIYAMTFNLRQEFGGTPKRTFG